jgi:hypothetical protein
MQETENLIDPITERIPWNKGKLIGPKPPLKQKHVWSIRTRLEIDHQTRDLALLSPLSSKIGGLSMLSNSGWWSAM